MWLFFAILAPACWALANPIDGALIRNFVRSNSMLTWMVSLTRLPLAIFLILLFAKDFIWGWHIFGVFVAGLLWMIPFVFYYKALEFEETSRVVLIMQFLPIFTFIVAAILVGERLDLHQSVAFLLIFIGSVLAAVKRYENKWHFSKAFILMLLAALGWAISDVMFKKFSVGFASFWQAFGVDILGSSLPAILFLLFPKERRIVREIKFMPKRGWVFFLISAIMGTMGSMAFAYALTLGKASLVAVITGLQPLFVLIFGFILGLMFTEIPRESLKFRDLLFKIFSLVLVAGGLAYLNDYV